MAGYNLEYSIPSISLGYQVCGERENVDYFNSLQVPTSLRFMY